MKEEAAEIKFLEKLRNHDLIIHLKSRVARQCMTVG
jgi:hypothetical protein